jgi:hypothetical protein
MGKDSEQEVRCLPSAFGEEIIISFLPDHHKNFV